MSVRRVQSGEPITAHWANSIVNALDTIGGNRQTTSSNVSGIAPQQFNNPAAFQIQMTRGGCWTIEAGSIFINGELIKGKGATYGNHYSSLQNWDNCYFHKGKTLPKWKIKGYIPKDATGSISGSKFWLINVNAEDGKEPSDIPTELPEGYTWWEQYINEVDDKQGTVKQIITGSLHITLPVAVATMRPFDITITGSSANDDDGTPNPDNPDNPDNPTPLAEGGTDDPETEGDEEEKSIVKFEVASGSILMPNKERIFIHQRLQMQHSADEPFYVVLTVKRDEEGQTKFKYSLVTEDAMAEDGWTFTEAIEEK